MIQRRLSRSGPLTPRSIFQYLFFLYLVSWDDIPALAHRKWHVLLGFTWQLQEGRGEESAARRRTTWRSDQEVQKWRLTRMCIGVTFPRWRALKEEIGLRFDTDVALILLDSWKWCYECNVLLAPWCSPHVRGSGGEGSGPLHVILRPHRCNNAEIL